MVYQLPRVKEAGWLAHAFDFYSATGQAFTIASISFIVCLLSTIAISLFTRAKDEKELVGLVYSLTPKQDLKSKTWYTNPLYLGMIVLAITLFFNVLLF